MFQVGRRNFINLQDYILIESDDEIDEDDLSDLEAEILAEL